MWSNVEPAGSLREGVLPMFLGTHAPRLDEKSRLILPARFREELAGGIPGARRETISSLHGHDGFLIEADQMDAILRDFLAGAS